MSVVGWKGRVWRPYFLRETYHINELDESQTKCHLNLLGHILDWSDEFVVASKEVTDKPLLLLGAQTWKEAIWKDF